MVGFTLIEVLVVLAIIAILAAMLLPVLSLGKAKGKRVACLNNLKQFAFSTQMYSADNDGKLIENVPLTNGFAPITTNSWVPGNMMVAADATNQALIRQGKLFPYASQVGTYHCPADMSQSSGVPRVRSYSMNGWMGSRTMERGAGGPVGDYYRSFVRESEIAVAGPATLWTIADEHEVTIDDAWFLVTMDDTRPFASFPAMRHDHGYALNFADGHVQTYRLRDPNTQPPGAQQTQINKMNSDWLRLKSVTTIR